MSNMSCMVLFIIHFVTNKPLVDKNGTGDEYLDKLSFICSTIGHLLRKE